MSPYVAPMVFYRVRWSKASTIRQAAARFVTSMFMTSKRYAEIELGGDESNCLKKPLIMAFSTRDYKGFPELIMILRWIGSHSVSYRLLMQALWISQDIFSARSSSSCCLAQTHFMFWRLPFKKDGALAHGVHSVFLLAILYWWLQLHWGQHRCWFHRQWFLM